MTATVFLHIGMPKCASTTVQHALRQNADWLSRQGFSYKKLAEDKTAGQGNAAMLGMAIMHDQRSDVKRMIDYFLSGEQHVILSSEALIGCARSS